MKKFLSIMMLLSTIALLWSCSGKKYAYPETAKVDSVDDFFGTKVPHP